MFYKILLFVLLFCVATFYIVGGGITHYAQERSGMNTWGGPTPGNSIWENETDESADHPTITAYASANVTNYNRAQPYGVTSGSIGYSKYNQYGCGTSSVSAESLTITIGDGEPETHEPQGGVMHKAFVYLNKTWQGGAYEGVWIEGWNNVDSTDYRGPYYETTAAYNSIEHRHRDNWYLSAEGDCSINNIKEKLLNRNERYWPNRPARAYAKAP